METRKKYVVRADGSIQVGSNSSIHMYMACGCPVKDCPGRAVSAGFYSFEDGKYKVWGESTTLGLKSRPEDADILLAQITHSK